MDYKETFSNHIKLAPVYASIDDLWVVTAFFNSHHNFSKRANYQLFIESLERSNINYLVVECAFNDHPFTLPDSPHIIKVRSDSILWQKERLINMAIATLPARCTKVAWVDCDVFFENADWAVETSRLLDEFPVVQPFDFVIRLPKGVFQYDGQGEIYESFSAVLKKNAGQLLPGDFFVHGHSGFAWAMRRDILAAYGLYGPCLSGSSDHLMVHAFCGDFYSHCIRQMLGDNPFTLQHFMEWARAIYPVIAGKVGNIKGTLLHAWHGDTANRQYLKRNQEITNFFFNPYDDICIGEGGCWEWSDKGLAKMGLQQWAVDFYGSRREDG